MSHRSTAAIAKPIMLPPGKNLTGAKTGATVNDPFRSVHPSAAWSARLSPHDVPHHKSILREAIERLFERDEVFRGAYVSLKLPFAPALSGP